jgi:hypothetical protein
MADAVGNVVAVLMLGAAFGGLLTMGAACVLPFLPHNRGRDHATEQLRRFELLDERDTRARNARGPRGESEKPQGPAARR